MTLTENKQVNLSISRQHAVYPCQFRIVKEDTCLQIKVYQPVMAKDERLRPAAMELVTRANYGLYIGNFEMDLKDGERRAEVLRSGGGRHDQRAPEKSLPTRVQTIQEDFSLSMMKVLKERAGRFAFKALLPIFAFNIRS